MIFICRVAYIQTNNIDRKLLAELFKDLEKSAGGDGNGIGGFLDNKPFICKSAKAPAIDFAGTPINYGWKNGFLFHTRRASVGSINNTNCHPFIWGDTITIHNGHIDGFGVLKLMMVENIDKYSVDGWTIEKIISTTDSDILAYFIWKRGFDIVSMMDAGTVITMYSDRVKMFVGYCLEAIQVGKNWIYASEFSDEMGLSADQWLIFGKSTELTVYPDGQCVIDKGYYVDGVELWKERQKKKKKGKGKYEVIEVA